jgi:hypothetical protein
MDKVPVFGTGDVGSIPTKGTGKEEAIPHPPNVFCGVETSNGGSQPTGRQGFPPRAHL